MSKLSQVKYSVLSFFCTVLFTGCSAKKALKSLLDRECIRITQETLQIALFASMFLNLAKKIALTFFLVYCPIFGVLCKREFEPPTSQSMCKKKSRNIANVGIQSYITKFIQKYFIISVYWAVLYTERFEPPHSLTTSRKN